MRAVIYARFSSDRQSEDSIHAQVRACEEYAKQKGIRIIGVYKDEAISGRETKTELRREYQRMLRDLKKHTFDAILIHKYDRVARSLSEHVNLETKLTKKGHRETALKGLHNGGYPPFGYDVVDQKYVINELEAAYVRKLFACALDRQGYKEVLKEMKDAGIVGKRGKEIKYPQVYEILRNEKYCGVYLYSESEEKNRSERRTKPNSIRIENAYPAIIDRVTYEEVQKIMTERKQSGQRANYLCSGLVYCACCGAKMHVYKSTRKGHTYYYYRCSKACGSSVVKMEDVDNAATAYVRELLSADTQLKVAQVLRTYKGHEKDRVESFQAAVAKKIAEKETAYNNLLTNMTSAVLPAEVIKDISDKMSKLKNEIEELKEATPPEDYSVDVIQEWLQSIRNAPDEKAVHLLIDRIEAVRTEDKTDFNISTTLKPVLEIVVAGEGFEPTTSGL